MTMLPSNNQRQIVGPMILVLAAACLLINLAGVTRLVYDVLVASATDNLVVKVVVLALVFVIGLGLGTLSQQQVEQHNRQHGDGRQPEGAARHHQPQAEHGEHDHGQEADDEEVLQDGVCLLYTSPSPRD